MKIKKIIAALLILILGASILAGCGDEKGKSGDSNSDDSDIGEENAALVGKWVHFWGYIYEFNEDGTGMWTMGETYDSPIYFIYEDKSDSLVLTFMYEDVLGDGPGDGYFYDEPKEFKYSITGRKLIIQDSFSDDMMEYEKK